MIRIESDYIGQPDRFSSEKEKSLFLYEKKLNRGREIDRMLKDCKEELARLDVIIKSKDTPASEAARLQEKDIKRNIAALAAEGRELMSELSNMLVELGK